MSIGRWMDRKLWYIYTMEYYSAIKKNASESVLIRWMKLEPITQSEVSQKEKHQYSMCVLVAQSCPTLCDPMDCNPPGSSVHEIFQARILEWVAVSFSRGSSQPRDRTRVSCTAGRFFTIWATREALLKQVRLWIFDHFFFSLACISSLISNEQWCCLKRKQ